LANFLMNRAHADDFSCRPGNGRHHATSRKFAHRFTGAKELAGEVNADDLVPLLQSHIVERGIALEARVGNNDVDGAELGDHFLEHGTYLSLVRYIRLEGECLDAEAAECIHHGLRGIVSVNIVDADVRPRLT
jgi:hypothetical protein